MTSAVAPFSRDWRGASGTPISKRNRGARSSAEGSPQGPLRATLKRWVDFPGRTDPKMSHTISDESVLALDGEQLPSVKAGLFELPYVRWLALAVESTKEYNRVHRTPGMTPVAAIMLGTTVLEVANAVRRSAPWMNASAVEEAIGLAVEWIKPRFEAFRESSYEGEPAAYGFGSGVILREQSHCPVYESARAEACQMKMVALAGKRYSRLALSLPLALLIASYALYKLRHPADEVRNGLRVALASAIEAYGALPWASQGRLFSRHAAVRAGKDLETLKSMLDSYTTNDGTLHGALEAAFNPHP